TSGNSALPRTPRSDPKQRVNDGQTMSDGQANGVHVSKVDYCGAPAASKESKKNTKTSKWERIKVKNVEQWVPSTREKELLRRTWSDDFEFLFDLGSSIYCYIFENNPKCKQLFPFILKYEGDEWKNSREFRAQALKFVQTISQVVKNIYHMSRLEPYLYGIGQAHCKYADRGFRPDHWDVFQ
ncbi:globin, partial [Teladorsagia circumcincta]